MKENLEDNTLKTKLDRFRNKILFVTICICLAILFAIIFPVCASAQIQGVCQPTAPCYCNEECFRCGPGGCSKSGGSGGSSAPPYNYEAERQRQEAERQRQLEAELQRQREEEARKIEFERKKQEVLKSMKGITKGELGLKETDAGGLGLKDIGETGSNVVDLRHLDPKKPIKVDPRKVKGLKASDVEPPASKIMKDIDEAKKRIPALEKT